ncbi:MAG: diguanylate cyclase [Pseudomonadales bacterium]
MQAPDDSPEYAQDKETIRNHLIDGYIAQLPASLLGVGVLVVLNYGYYRDYLPGAIMATWLTLMLAGLTPYVAIVYRHKAAPAACWNQRCINTMAAATLFLGLGWSSLAIYGIEYLETAQSYVAIIIAAGVVGAATATNAALPVVFKALVWPALAPLIIVMLLSDHSGYRVVGFACLVYMMVMLKSLQQIHQSLHQSIALTITNASLIKSLEQQSTTDVLTDLLNRRALNNGFEQAWNQSLASGQPIGLVLCDVDFFKAYNDALGHQAGDACLARIGRALNAAIDPQQGLVARYGGEEFAVLINHCDTRLLQDVSERVLKLVAGLQLAHPASAANAFVTVSVGASQLAASANHQVEDLLNCADNALYSAKASGRNRIRQIIPQASATPRATSAQTIAGEVIAPDPAAPWS